MVPTLLSWPASAVIHDIKGENWQITAGWRSRFSHCLLLSTAMSFLGLYRDPTVAEVTSRCDWRIADLIASEHPVSLYLVVPPSDISRTKPLVRLILNQIGRRLTESLDGSDGIARRTTPW